MNRVLIIGSGGREHALAAAFAKSPTVETVTVAPGNPGMRNVAEIADIPADDFPKLKAYIRDHRINLVFVGPEAPLSKGIVDDFTQDGIRIFGPTQAAARLESSKSFAKALMNKYGIPTAGHVTVQSKAEALDYLSTHKAPIVIKADGLMAGKGVTVAMDDTTALQAVEEIYPDDSDRGPLVIEEYLEGEEFSLLAFVQGEKVFPLDIARDHKRAYDNDQGPNTGGMGAYSPVPKIRREQVEEAMTKVMRPIAKAMVQEGYPFTGVLYGGLMATKEGIKTIEFNVRFGDPETEVLLPRLLNPLDQVVLDVLAGKDVELAFDPRFCLGVVLASKGYPGPYEKNLPIHGLERLESPLYHMGTGLLGKETVNTGGRVLLVHDFGKDLEEARERVYSHLEQLDAPQLFWRTDIGK